LPSAVGIYLSQESAQTVIQTGDLDPRQILTSPLKYYSSGILYINTCTLKIFFLTFLYGFELFRKQKYQETEASCEILPICTTAVIIKKL